MTSTYLEGLPVMADFNTERLSIPDFDMRFLLVAVVVVLGIVALGLNWFFKPKPGVSSHHPLIFVGLDGKSVLVNGPAKDITFPLLHVVKGTDLEYVLKSDSVYITAGSRVVDINEPPTATIFRLSARLPGGSAPLDNPEDLMVAMLNGTGVVKHGMKVAAGLTRFYKYTTPKARELAEIAYPWLVDRFKTDTSFDKLWTVKSDGTEAPQIVHQDMSKPLSLHPMITYRFKDTFSEKTINGLQILLAIALTVNPELDEHVKVAVDSQQPVSVSTKVIRMVTMPGARKSHGTGVCLLRFNSKERIVIDTAITSTFKERLDVPFYWADASIRDAASRIDQRRDRDDFMLFNLDCYSDSIPQLGWITLGLESICVAMFGANCPSRGLNADIAHDGTDAFGRLQQLWQQVLTATNAGAKIYPHRPHVDGEEPRPSFQDMYDSYLKSLDPHDDVAACYHLIRTMSQLADTGDFDAFPPLHKDAWAANRPTPRGLIGDAAPREPPTVGYQHHFKRNLSPSRTRGRSPVNSQFYAAVPRFSRSPDKYRESEMLPICEANENVK